MCKKAIKMVPFFIGIIIFICIYGIRILNPFYDAWLLQGERSDTALSGVSFFQNEQLAVSAWGYEQNMLSGRGFCCLYRFDSDCCHYHKAFSQCITTALSVFWLVGDIVLWLTGVFCGKTAVPMDQR